MTESSHYHYRCDYGHAWTVEGHPMADPRCESGHPAVTCVRDYPADRVQILLKPLARISDLARPEQLTREGLYRVILQDRNGKSLCWTKEPRSWDRAIQLAGFFQGKSESEALRWWKRRRLG